MIEKQILTGFVACMAMACSPNESSDTSAKAVDVSESALESNTLNNDMPKKEEMSDFEPIKWQTRFSPDIAYFNMSDKSVNAFAEASPDSEVVAKIVKGNGGFIQDCNETVTWCKISFGGYGKTGWVDMTTFGGRAD